MRAIIIKEYGCPDVMHLGEQPRPSPDENEILLRIHAVGVNPADAKWRAGMFAQALPRHFPYIPGYDVAGVIEAGTSKASGLMPGQRVMAMLDPLKAGAYAEFAVVPATQITPMPAGLDFTIAAALPTPGLTGVQLIEDELNVQRGAVVLITGAMGAVGRFALHAAKARGAYVVAAVRPQQLIDALYLGADETIILGDGEGEQRPFDAVADTVGGLAVASLCKHIKPHGLIRSVSTTPIPSNDLPVEPAFFAVRQDPVRLSQLAIDVAAGRIPVPIARRLPLEQAVVAHRLIEAGGTGGKIILTL